MQQLDLAWAEGKEDMLTEARALAAILTHLESMGYAARRELAAWLRRWLHRVMALHEAQSVQMPAAPDAQEVMNVVARLTQGETETRGIVEQRLVDSLALLRHRAPQWATEGYWGLRERGQHQQPKAWGC